MNNKSRYDSFKITFVSAKYVTDSSYNIIIDTIIDDVANNQLSKEYHDDIECPMRDIDVFKKIDKLVKRIKDLGAYKVTPSLYYTCHAANDESNTNQTPLKESIYYIEIEWDNPIV